MDLDLTSIARRAIELHERGGLGQVSVPGTGIGVTDRLHADDVRRDARLLRDGLYVQLHGASVPDHVARRVAEGLVREGDPDGPRRVLLVCGKPLVGCEAIAEARARAGAMRDDLAERLDEALCEEMPVTVRQQAAERS